MGEAIGTSYLVRLQIDIDECYSACTIHGASITCDGVCSRSRDLFIF